MIQESVKKILFCCLLILNPLFSESLKIEKVPVYIEYAENIMNLFIEECTKEYQVECIGTGGQFARNFGGASIRFIALRRGTIEEARNLEVKMTERLLFLINQNEKIRPFLREYPFNINEIDITIAFQKSDGSCYADGSVVFVIHAKDKLFYSAEDPKTGRLVDIMEESYETALKIVKGKLVEEKKISF